MWWRWTSVRHLMLSHTNDSFPSCLRVEFVWNSRKCTHMGSKLPHESSTMSGRQRWSIWMGSSLIRCTAGAVLGPLLFLIYIGNITEGISSELRLFADDCLLYRVIKSTRDCEILPQDLDRLVSKSERWLMRLMSRSVLAWVFTSWSLDTKITCIKWMTWHWSGQPSTNIFWCHANVWPEMEYSYFEHCFQSQPVTGSGEA